jgi:3',5'-cyclic AMP phosphodiesterase CpdA
MSKVLLRFAHISDTHLTPGDRTEMRVEHYSPRVLALIRSASVARNPDGAAHENPSIPPSVATKKVISEINRLPFPIDFVLHTGDIMTDATVDEYLYAKDLFSALNYPIYYIPGNHDNSEGIQRNLVGVETVKPTYDYVVEIKGMQLVCVDSASSGMDHGGKLNDDQLAWLDSICSAASDQPLIVAIHHHIRPFDSQFIDFFGTQNGDEIHAILRKAGSRLRGVFSGHIHQAIDIYDDNILYSFVQAAHMQSNLFPAVTVTGKHEVSPNPGFSIVTVTTERTFVRRYNFAF